MAFRYSKIWCLEHRTSSGLQVLNIETFVAWDVALLWRTISFDGKSQHTEQSHFVNYVFFRIDRVFLCWKWFSFGVLSRADLCSPLIYCRAQHSKPQSNQTFDLISPGFRSTNFSQNNRSFKLCPKGLTADIDMVKLGAINQLYLTIKTIYHNSFYTTN